MWRPLRDSSSSDVLHSDKLMRVGRPAITDRGKTVASFEHKQLLRRLSDADEIPSDDLTFASWMQGEAHLQFLRDNERATELVIAALSPFPRPTCINSYIVPADSPKLQDGALSFASWSPNPYHHDAARYSWSWGSEGVTASLDIGSLGGKLPAGASPLVFFRSAEGDEQISREIVQDFIHAAGVFWRRERKAYSKLDHRGDWLDVVSQSTREDSASVDLISVHRETLDLHLVALDAVLVRVFEFDLHRGSLSGRPDFDSAKRRRFLEEPALQYHTILIEGQLNRIRGAQVIRPRLTDEQIDQLVRQGRTIDESESERLDFVVYDMRNERTVTVSTDESSTTSYFEAARNHLPYDTSPAFFRPEVLSKYKADREKYTISESDITCRAAWSLRNYSVNEAGQVAVYICYIRDLPLEEQLHWKAYNEEPKTGLSERAIQNDFLGQWAEESTPLEELGLILDRWRKSQTEWWSSVSEYSHDRLTMPYGENRDEWSRAIVDLANAVVEGFRVRPLRKVLERAGAEYQPTEKSIALLERCLRVSGVLESTERLESLRSLQQLRTVGGGVHAVGERGRKLANEALEEHGTYSNHFQNLCAGIVSELRLIHTAFDGE